MRMRFRSSSRFAEIVFLLVMGTAIRTASSKSLFPPVVYKYEIHALQPIMMEPRAMQVSIPRPIPLKSSVVEFLTSEGLANKGSDFIYTASKAPGANYYTGGIAAEILCTSDYSVVCWIKPGDYDGNE